MADGLTILATRPPPYRQHDFDTGFEREHGRSWKENLCGLSDTSPKEREVSRRSVVTCFQEVGLSHSSDEVPVMGMERRAWVISLTDSQTNSQRIISSERG